MTACPRCATPLAEDQEWCLSCGAAARTVIARSPRWRMPLALLTVIAVLSLAALAVAFVALANTDADVRVATAPATPVGPATPAPPAPGGAPIPAG